MACLYELVRRCTDGRTARFGHAAAPREERQDDRWTLRTDQRNHGMSVAVHKVKLVQGKTSCTVLIVPSAVAL